jgi:hypothetical protein
LRKLLEQHSFRHIRVKIPDVQGRHGVVWSSSSVHLVFLFSQAPLQKSLSQSVQQAGKITFPYAFVKLMNKQFGR